MRNSPQQAHVGTQAFGVVAMVIVGLMAAQVSIKEPISFLPVAVVYLFAQAAFRLGLAATKRPRGRRNLFFIV